MQAKHLTLMFVTLMFTASALPLAPPEKCTGPGCWSCDAPYESTHCVLSSWTGWKGDRDKFASQCNGNLVRWGDDSGVQDCGQACLFCSYIRACCDTCKTILEVEGEWERIRCLDAATEITYSYGVSSTESRRAPKKRRCHAHPQPTLAPPCQTRRIHTVCI